MSDITISAMLPPCDGVLFDAAKLTRLIKAHATATARGKELFQFEGHTLCLDYASYLISYVRSELAAATNKPPHNNHQ